MTAATLTRTTRHAYLAYAVRAFEEHKGLPLGTYTTAPAVDDAGTHLHLRDTTAKPGHRFAGIAVPGLDGVWIVTADSCPLCHRRRAPGATFTVNHRTGA